MNKSVIGLLLLILLVFTACVPLNDIIYLQDNGKNANEAVTKSELKPYRLQTNDNLMITIKAIDIHSSFFGNQLCNISTTCFL